MRNSLKNSRNGRIECIDISRRVPRKWGQWIAQKFRGKELTDSLQFRWNHAVEHFHQFSFPANDGDVNEEDISAER